MRARVSLVAVLVGALWFALAGCGIRPPVVSPQPTTCVSAVATTAAPGFARAEVCVRAGAAARDDDDDDDDDDYDAWFLDDDESSTVDSDDTTSSPSDDTDALHDLDDGNIGGDDDD